MSATVELERLKVPGGLFRRLRIPAWVVDSGQPGPALLLTAAQHGNEVQGCEAIRRFVERAAAELVRGRVFAVPIANPRAVRERRPHIRMWPEQPYEKDRGLNMNRAWPGRRHGSIVARSAQAIYRAFGEEATHVLDLHCWQKHAAPALLVQERPDLRRLAEQLGAPFVELRPLTPGTLAGHVVASGRVGLTYECSGQYTLDERQIQAALQVICNLARIIGLLPGQPAPADSAPLFSDDCEVVDVAAAAAGLFLPAPLSPGDRVDKGQPLGRILMERDLVLVPVLAPAGGRLKAFGVSRPDCDVSLTGHHPYVAKRDLLARIWRPRTQAPLRGL